jgi:hypothetical protein
MSEWQIVGLSLLFYRKIIPIIKLYGKSYNGQERGLNIIIITAIKSYKNSGDRLNNPGNVGV